MSRASKIAPAVRIRQSPPLLPPASRRGFFFNHTSSVARPGAEVAEMGSNRPPSLSSVGLRGPDAAQAASYAVAAYPLRGSNPKRLTFLFGRAKLQPLRCAWNSNSAFR